MIPTNSNEHCLKILPVNKLCLGLIFLVFVIYYSLLWTGGRTYLPNLECRLCSKKLFSLYNYFNIALNPKNIAEADKKCHHACKFNIFTYSQAPWSNNHNIQPVMNKVEYIFPYLFILNSLMIRKALTTLNGTINIKYVSLYLKYVNNTGANI